MQNDSTDYDPRAPSATSGASRKKQNTKAQHRPNTPKRDEALDRNPSNHVGPRENPKSRARRPPDQSEGRGIPDLRSLSEGRVIPDRRSLSLVAEGGMAGARPRSQPRENISSSAMSGIEVQIVQYLLGLGDQRCGAKHITEICRDLMLETTIVNEVIRSRNGNKILTLDKTGNVSLACPVDLCKGHWASAGCGNGDSCKNIHICKFYIIGSCENVKCKFGHNLQSALLKQHHMSILGLGESDMIRLLQMSDAVKNKGLPPVCTYYNKSNCTKGNKCSFMHICSDFLTKMTCRNGGACQRSHNLLDPRVQEILNKHGFIDNSSNLDILLKDLRYSSSKGDVTDTTNPLIGVSPEKKKFPQVCVFHNKPSGCDKGIRCEFLHLCKRYITDNSCPFAAKCRYSHNLQDKQVVDRIATCGIDVRFVNKEGILRLIRQDVNASKEPVSRDMTERKSEKRNEICMFNLQNRCKCSDLSCRYYHSSMPYLWQFENCGKWNSFSDDNNQTIETAFCDPKNETLSLKEDTCGAMRIDFQMMQYNEPASGRVQRLSTKSWGEAYENRPFVTKWSWYWLDEYNHWNEYENPKDIEEQCLKGESEICYKSKQHEYIIKFQDMKQENQVHHTKREIRRRPKLNRPPNLESQESVVDSKYPNAWKIANEEDSVQVVSLKPESQEYQEVKRRFDETLPVPIQQITRIENPDLWDEYYNMKRRMFKKKMGKVPTEADLSVMSSELNEKLLFHGTRQKYIEAIYEHRGFDFRNAGSSTGTLWGKGNYFARDARYSRDYTVDCNVMFAVRVLVGETAQGNPTFVKPPPKDPSKPYGNLFDTCVDNPGNPEIYVTFEFGQSYPAYLIHY